MKPQLPDDPDAWDDVDAEDYSDPDEGLARCGCLYCWRPLMTEYGEPCPNCRLGAHQG